jgi:hypothetical protein
MRSFLRRTIITKPSHIYPSSTTTPLSLAVLSNWGINLAIADVNGLTALHCAYMKGDLESVRTLRRGGASETVTDKLGRTPSELCQRRDLTRTIDLDAEVAGWARRRSSTRRHMISMSNGIRRTVQCTRS